MNRRDFMRQFGMTTAGAGSLSLMAAAGKDKNNYRRMPAKAKNIIIVHLVGAPSHLDLWYHRPGLEKMNGKELPDGLFKDGKQFAFIKGRPRLMASRYKFEKVGQAGHAMSNLIPNLMNFVLLTHSIVVNLTMDQHS